MDPIITKGVAESPFPNTYSSGVNDAIAVIRAHVPSITDEMDEGEEEPWTDLWPRDEMGDYIGDKRVCHCGLVLDGYYEYVEHLIEMLGGKGLVAPR